MPGGWRRGALPSRDEKALSMQFVAGAGDDPEHWKEFALAVFNLNAFLYVN